MTTTDCLNRLDLLAEYLDFCIQYTAPRYNSFGKLSGFRPWEPTFSAYLAAVERQDICAVFVKDNHTRFAIRESGVADSLYWHFTHYCRRPDLPTSPAGT